MKKTVLILMIITIFSKILGFSREVFLSYFYGASSISDIYLIAWTIPGVIFAFVGVGLSTNFIPMYNSITIAKGSKDADKFVNNTINLLLVISTLIVAIIFVFTPQIVKIFAGGFTGKTLETAILFTRISVFGIYFSAYIYIFSAYLNIKGNFIIPALIGVPFNLVLILSIYLSSRVNTVVLAFGIVLSKVVEFLFLLPWLKKNKFNFSLKFDFKDENIKKMIFLTIPLIFGVSINQINVLVDRTMASTIMEGGISIINYASKINGFIQITIVEAFITIFFPMVSKIISENSLDKLKGTVAKAISFMIIVLTPLTFIIASNSKIIVDVLLTRGAFLARDADLTAKALLFFSIGMVVIGIREISVRIFYSMQDTKTPTKNAVIGMIVNILFNLLLAKKMGVSGLALATTISAVVTMVLLQLDLRKKYNLFETFDFKIFIKSIVASLIITTIFEILKKNVEIKFGIVYLVLSSIAFLIIYVLVLYMMKTNEIKEIKNDIIKKIRDRNQKEEQC